MAMIGSTDDHLAMEPRLELLKRLTGVRSGMDRCDHEGRCSVVCLFGLAVTLPWFPSFRLGTRDAGSFRCRRGRVRIGCQLVTGRVAKRNLRGHRVPEPEFGNEGRVD